MKLKFGSPRGMSLVEVMVTTAVASVIMVAIGNSLISLYQHQSTITKKDVGNEFAADFSRVLSQNDACSVMLSGVLLQAGAGPTEFTIPDFIIAKKDDALVTPTADDLFAGQDIYDGLRCDSLTIENSSLPDDNLTIDWDGDGTQENVIRRIAEISLRLSVVNSNGNQEMKPRRFQIPVLVDAATQQVLQCSTELQVTDACSAIGSVVDPGTGTCLPASNCFMRGSFTRINCEPATASCPSEIVNPITSATTCPSAVMESQTGQFLHTYVENCGKKCTRTINVTTRYFVCLECS